MREGAVNMAEFRKGSEAALMARIDREKILSWADAQVATADGAARRLDVNACFQWRRRRASYFPAFFGRRVPRPSCAWQSHPSAIRLAGTVQVPLVVHAAFAPFRSPF